MRQLRSRALGALAITTGLLAPLVSGQSAEATGAITFKDGFWGPIPDASQRPIFTATAFQKFTFENGLDINVADVVLFQESNQESNKDSNTIASATNDRGINPSTPTGTTTATSTRATVTPTSIPTSTSTTSPGAAIATSTTTSAGQQIGSRAALTAGRGILGSLGKREDENNLTFTYDSVSLPDNSLYKKLYLRVGWKNSASGMSGYTYSRGFVYVNEKDIADENVLARVRPLVSDTGPVYPETTFSETPTATSAATKTSSTAKTTSSDDSGGSLTSGGNGTTSGTTSSNKKGLATGAIVGIVIGVIAALVIVGGIAFYFYRRRARSGRLSGSAEPYRGSGSEQIGLQSGFASAGVAEKDGIVDGSVSGFGNGASGGAHSPYSDDDGVVGAGVGAVHARSVGVSPTATTARAANRSTPASPVPTSTQPASAGASTVAPKAAVSGQVAALIEEDMTAEDVARLEAEERELDAAIENAQRSRHASQAGQS
ncbi:hypothetical protein F503_04509 [Ophiostoma piceae UAMH 11346]|uniref:Mid2 domain-containing protein n=1 Tax=Ophiostoma piceae (strain UAMH 11346) TaxID=1262450 RepID=S3C7W5_OPHP1|nr:hypothetical protein F503_04509 [Ophiostoma piceae UAMH 11346]